LAAFEVSTKAINNFWRHPCHEVIVITVYFVPEKVRAPPFLFMTVSKTESKLNEQLALVAFLRIF
jgi:hypothetical protein